MNDDICLNNDCVFVHEALRCTTAKTAAQGLPSLIIYSTALLRTRLQW